MLALHTSSLPQLTECRCPFEQTDLLVSIQTGVMNVDCAPHALALTASNDPHTLKLRFWPKAARQAFP
jgi:hypothetical protein